MASKTIKKETDNGKKDWRIFLVNGYIHKIEFEYKLFMEIPIEIFTLIYNFYPKLRIFEIYSSDKFEVFGKGHEIRGKGSPSDCGGYLIYPSCDYLSNKGYKKGIYYFSMKAHNVLSCYHAIGVKSERNSKWINKSSRKFHNGGNINSYLQRTGKYPWRSGQTMTLKLDLINYKVTYYLESNIKPFQTDNIEPNYEYFMAFQLCQRKENHFEIVETPEIIWKKTT